MHAQALILTAFRWGTSDCTRTFELNATEAVIFDFSLPKCSYLDPEKLYLLLDLSPFRVSILPMGRLSMG
jgi:hypothetical protein